MVKCVGVFQGKQYSMVELVGISKFSLLWLTLSI